ncbi:MAG: RagB/SusD family nutrient uptake outer membrane protein [Chitinophagaceae bacterium]|nr:RagB/SusD family nutrient uptake outer membrane protein [Chitinophagaceae bacterium]
MKHIIYLLFSVTAAAGCGKLLDKPSPTDRVATTTIRDTDIPLLVRAIYQQSTNNGLYGFYVLQDIMSDDVTGTGFVDFESNNIPNNSTYVQAAYAQPFKGVFAANQVIRYVEDKQKVTVLGAAYGEALFMRAYNYFRLVQHFGGVAIVNGTEPMDAKPFRNTEQEVYEEIIRNLKTAIGYLSDYDGNSLLPSKQAAQALLARIYLFLGKYPEARQYAQEVITAGKNELEPNFGSMFNDNTTSKEMIWRQTETGDNTVQNGLAIVYGPGPTSKGRPGGNSIWLDPDLVSKYETGDIRKAGLYDSLAASINKVVTFLVKFKVSQKMNPTYPILRLSEMYLILAETDARNNIVDVTNLNLVRAKRGASPAVVANISSPAAMIDTIEVERRKEFVGEGLRWYDMRRLGKAIPWLDSKMKPKGYQLLPMPFNEIFYNPNTTPNPDYN